MAGGQQVPDAWKTTIGVVTKIQALRCSASSLGPWGLLHEKEKLGLWQFPYEMSQSGPAETCQYCLTSRSELATE